VEWLPGLLVRQNRPQKKPPGFRRGALSLGVEVQIDYHTRTTNSVTQKQHIATHYEVVPSPLWISRRGRLAIRRYFGAKFVPSAGPPELGLRQGGCGQPPPNEASRPLGFMCPAPRLAAMAGGRGRLKQKIQKAGPSADAGRPARGADGPNEKNPARVIAARYKRYQIKEKRHPHDTDGELG
jgi:hypothetical protein